MKGKILRYALISSPILALYGASPFYIFGVLSSQKFVMVFFSALLSAFMYWAFNAYLFVYSKIKRKCLLFTLSYLFAYLSNVFKVFFGVDVSEIRGDVLDYMIYPLITVLALNGVILIIIYSVLQEDAKRKAEERVASLNLANLQAQRQALTRQLQPHFLFNALSTAKSLIHDDQDLAENYVVQLADFLRYSVDSHNNDLVTVESELKFVNNYINLQKIRFGDGLHCEINIDEKIFADQVPIFAIQTLLENAIKHNYFTEKNPLRIVVSHSLDQITVSNNIASPRLTERKGTGLENLNKRYLLYGDKAITINKETEHFSVTIPILRL